MRKLKQNGHESVRYFLKLVYGVQLLYVTALDCVEVGFDLGGRLFGKE